MARMVGLLLLALTLLPEMVRAQGVSPVRKPVAPAFGQHVFAPTGLIGRPYTLAFESTYLPVVQEESITTDRPNTPATNGKENGKNGNGEKKDEPEEVEDEEEEEDDIETDRPDFTESSKVVGKGRVQLETGYTMSYDKTLFQREWDQTFPEALLRIGVTDCLEFRCYWTYEVCETLDRITNVPLQTDGGNDVELGFKLALTPQMGLFPESAVILATTVPVGARAFTANTMHPRVNFLYSWDVCEDISIGGSTGIGSDLEDDDGYTFGHQSLTSSYAISERVGAFLETFGHFRSGFADSRPELYVDGGFTYKPKPYMQLDWRAGVGLNERASDFFIGVGFSIVRH